MHLRSAICLVLTTGIALVSAFPLPFSRELKQGSTGQDVFILQGFLGNAPRDKVPSVNESGVFDLRTEEALSKFQTWQGMRASGVLDEPTSEVILGVLTDDHYRDDGLPPTAHGDQYLYKIVVPVHRNRSIESKASLIATNGSTIFTFTVRAHGYSLGPDHTWPDFNNSGPGRNQMASCGNTPTGLSQADLNSPESIPREYGPYPVNRMVQGIQGNARWSVPNIRDGILMHTGEWPGWAPPAPMPNSAGCVHSWPASIERVWHLLTNELGVQVRPNSNGKLPYPYKPQGLFSVYYVD